MCKLFNTVRHLLLAAALPAMILADLQENDTISFCGPVDYKGMLTHECYDYASGDVVLCQDKYEIGKKISKKCREEYVSYPTGNLNTTMDFVCTKGDQGAYWSEGEYRCAAECGISMKTNKYPWIVAIYDAEEELVCSGSIISESYVLTAATCFTLDHRYSIKDPANYTIVAGRHYINFHRRKESAQIVTIKSMSVHPDISNYSDLYWNNLVLIEVEPTFKFREHVRAICLDLDSYYDVTDYVDGNEAVAVGWQYSDGNEVVPCQNHNNSNVQIWQRRTCHGNLPAVYSHSFLTDDDKLCGTYINDKSTCIGGQGAGLFFKSNLWRYYLKGVTSYVTSQSGATFVFFSKVSRYFDWLKSKTKLAVTRDSFYHRTELGCKLPEHIQYGRFSWIFGKAYRKNAWVPYDTVILLHCFGTETPISIRCVFGEWNPPINKLSCTRPGSCPTISSSASEEVICRFNGQTVDCAEAETNTTAIIRCKPFHVISGDKPIYKCQNGKWDQPFTRCRLECGTKRVRVATLVIGGSPTEENEYPWVVAVYRSEEQICGGTLISKSLVLSAAHCFTTSKGVPLNKELYTIVAGKYHRNYSVQEPWAQSRKVKLVHVHDDYKGSLHKHRDDIALVELEAEVIPSLQVQPICVDWDSLYEDYDFIDGTNAVVTGWGYTKPDGPPSDVLNKVIVPYRQKAVCLENLPADFSYEYVTADKICAGVRNNNITVCTGDSGGGLYFRSADNRFYVRGIVSLTVKTSSGTCAVNNFALYTKVSKYLPWMEAITRRVL